MCDVCGDAQHEPQVSRRDFLRTGALAALVPWSVGVAIAADPPAPGAPPLPNAIAPADALKRLMEGDKNGDGKLSKQELPDFAGELFADFDVNKDGVLDRDEIRKLAERLIQRRRP